MEDSMTTYLKIYPGKRDRIKNLEALYTEH